MPRVYKSVVVINSDHHPELAEHLEGVSPRGHAERLRLMATAYLQMISGGNSSAPAPSKPADPVLEDRKKLLLGVEDDYGIV